MPNLELSPLSTDFTYNTWVGGPTRAPVHRDLAALSDGGFASVWSTDTGIYLRFHDSTGQAEDGGVVVASVRTSPDVAVHELADGSIVVFYMDLASLSVQRLSADGTLVGDAVELGVRGSGRYDTLRNLETAVLEDGGYVARWNIGSYNESFAIYEADGTMRGDAVTISMEGALGPNESQLQVDVQEVTQFDDGTIGVVFMGRGRETFIDSFQDFRDLYLQKLNADGTRAGDPVRLTDDGNVPGRTQMTQLNDGNIAFAWNINAGVYVQVFDTDGALVSQMTRVDDPEAYGSYYTTSIVALDNGGFAVGYFQGAVGSDPVSARVFDAQGVAQGAPVVLGVMPDSETENALINIGDGRYVMQTTDQREGFEVLNLNTLAEGELRILDSLVLREDLQLDPTALDLSGITDVNGVSQLEDYTVAFEYYHANGTSTGWRSAFMDPDDPIAYAPGDDHVGMSVAAIVRFTDDAGNVETVTSAPTLRTVEAVNDAPITTNFRVGGTPREAERLSVTLGGYNGVYETDGFGSFEDRSVQWFRDGVAIEGATEMEYRPVQADVGFQLTAQVAYVDGQGFTEVVTTAPTRAIDNSQDPLQGTATFTGTPEQYATVTVDASGLSDEDGIAAIRYQFLVNGYGYVQDGEDNTFTPDEQIYVGREMRVRITVTDDYNSSSTRDLTIGTIENVNDAPDGLPVITGDAREDVTLSVDTSGISDVDGLRNVTYSYQWLRDGVEIEGAVEEEYQLGQDDVDHQISVRVEYTDNQGTEETLTSAPTAQVANVNDPGTGRALLLGSMIEDAELRADTSELADEDGLGPFTYQWLRDAIEISDATEATYQLGQDDVGSQMSVRVSYVDSYGTTESQTVGSTWFDPVQNVDDPVMGVVVIQGTPLEEEVLTADISGLTDEDGTREVTYQWYADGVVIGGANLSEFRPRETEIGKQLTVEVTHIDNFWDSETIESAATAPIDALPRFLVGGIFEDFLTGNLGDDTILGDEGADRLSGLAGDDSIDGGLGADVLIGGVGNDTLLGGSGAEDLRDVIYGGDGNDSIDGGAGNDELRGDAGLDTITGGVGVDTIFGGTGDDILTGQAWSDLIFGGDGADFINGGFGYDRVNGGAGADRFFHLGVGDHGSDWIQDYSAVDGDVLQFGGAATRDQFQINLTETQNAGDAGVQEAFVIYRPTGQILWALVDGSAQTEINLLLAGTEYNLLA